MESLGTNSSSGPGLQSEPVFHERRRLARQRAHTPAYAMITTPADSAAVEFNEILDVSEEGICVSSAESYHVNHDVDLCLELPETQSKVQSQGQVVWSKDGRAGIQFVDLPQPSLHELREWLHLNGIVAAADQNASERQDAVSTAEGPPEPSTQIGTNHSPETPDFSSLLVALEAVRREAIALAPDVEAALQLIANRAQTFTRASGAAIAFFEGNSEEMLCRASSGDAPSIGSRLQVSSGFSGQCIRTGKLLRCDDSELNLFVDRDSCRALGIRSIVAVPIGSIDRVRGILEAFSPTPRSFDECDDAVLTRLAEIAMTVVTRGKAKQVVANSTMEAPTQNSLEALADELSSSRLRRLLLIVASAILAIVLLIFLGTRFRHDPVTGSQPTPASTTAPSQATPVTGNDLESLRKLADAGDAAAQFAVGAHYATGDGVTQDYSEAVRWFTRAAEQGHVVAQGTLGAYYWNALGVRQDLNQAYFWSILAQAGGDQASKYRASILASRLTRAEVIAAQQQANDWLKQHQKPASTR